MSGEVTRGEAWRQLSAVIDRLDARLLIEHVTGVRHAQLIATPEAAIDAADWAQLQALAGRRAAGEPLAYLVGWAPFGDLTLHVSDAVLVPRPETERLVELTLAAVVHVPAPRVLDLGTGSGAIALAIKAARPDARVWAVDVSAAALAVAVANGAQLGLEVAWRAGHWYDALTDANCFDAIVSNPPYVAAGDAHLGGDGVRFEPVAALTDGADGLDCLREIIARAPQHLVAGGPLRLEHGHDQGAACRALLVAAGFVEVATWQDLAGIDRVSGGRWPG